ncbi:MAG: sigma 54-interacting transcriptional regulator [Acidobacteria bacterium]|nr:sigma 54-interacting transcriptional regulator [Acidobacteriota bacterium]
MQRLAESTEFIGESPPVRRLLRNLAQVAPTGATVLISGETGTGKELAARTLHAASARCDRAFVTVDCAAVPENLIESELFGHLKGAFTGATAERRGLFAVAHQGTIFLDEVGELPLELQARLLRVLQEGELLPVGSSRTLEIDVRVLAASNRNLQTEIEKGRFRCDLFYRLNVFPVHLPPLRERGGDVALLAAHFARRCARRLGREFVPLSEEDIDLLSSYDWPGNVRELQNVIERAAIVSRSQRLDLRRALFGTTGSAFPLGAGPPELPGIGTTTILTRDDLRDLERRNIARALEASDWKVSGRGGAAEALQMNPSTLASRIRALSIGRTSAA